MKQDIGSDSRKLEKKGVKGKIKDRGQMKGIG